MKAEILEILFPDPESDMDHESEIIAYGAHCQNSKTQDLLISKYHALTKYKGYGLKLKGAVSIKDMIGTDLRSIDINWDLLKERIQHQLKTRPRGIGCRFRFSHPEDNHPAFTNEHMEYINELLLDRINDELSQSKDVLFIFLGALWDSETRRRFGSPVLIEAPSMNCASNITELYLKRQRHQTVLTAWCPIIYNCSDLS